MKIKSFTFNYFQENSFVIYDDSKDCIIIDPGCYSVEEEEELENFITKNNLTPVKVINTHCHIDHILGNNFVINKWNIDLYIHELEVSILNNAKEISSIYGFEKYKISPLPNKFLSEGDTINFGRSKLDILYTPGHSPGHICLYHKKENILISGDIIFKGSVGRTDLPGGNHQTLIQSIHKKILPMPDNTVIFCGHGPSTILEKEKKENPFL